MAFLSFNFGQDDDALMVHSVVYRAEETPHRKGALVSGDGGNVIRPTRCTDQGTSYRFTNLLLPQ